MRIPIPKLARSILEYLSYEELPVHPFKQGYSDTLSASKLPGWSPIQLFFALRDLRKGRSPRYPCAEIDHYWGKVQALRYDKQSFTVEEARLQYMEGVLTYLQSHRLAVTDPWGFAIALRNCLASTGFEPVLRDTSVVIRWPGRRCMQIMPSTFPSHADGRLRPMPKGGHTVIDTALFWHEPVRLRVVGQRMYWR